MTQKTAFVLSGGSSRGALQAGALEVLLQAGPKPDMILGTSVGALNAAYFATNPTPAGVQRLQEVYLQTDFGDVFAGSPIEVVSRALQGKASLYRNDRLVELIQKEYDAIQFQELDLRCYVIATDLDTGERRVFGDDPADRVVDGLMSSAAMTPLHPPWRVNGRAYADGGLVAMLPVTEAIERGATRVIALNLATQLMPSAQRENVLDMLLHAIDLLIQGQVRSTLHRALDHTEATVQVIDLVPDEYVSFNDMSRMDELIESGRQITERALQAFG